jgi:ribosome-binding factor A
MPTPLRLKRISDRIHQELSEMLIKDIHDPRLTAIFITEVKVDRELAFADVYVSAVEGHERAEEVVQTLTHAGTFLRRELAHKVELRVFPRLRFHWDPTPERADHIEQLLKQMRDNS